MKWKNDEVLFAGLIGEREILKPCTETEIRLRHGREIKGKWRSHAETETETDAEVRQGRQAGSKSKFMVDKK